MVERRRGSRSYREGGRSSQLRSRRGGNRDSTVCRGGIEGTVHDNGRASVGTSCCRTGDTGTGRGGIVHSGTGYSRTIDIGRGYDMEVSHRRDRNAGSGCSGGDDTGNSRGGIDDAGVSHGGAGNSRTDDVGGGGFMKVNHGRAARGIGISIMGIGTSAKGITTSVEHIVIHHGRVRCGHDEVDGPGWDQGGRRHYWAG